MDYMSTSDGYGNEGQRGDCGHAIQNLVDCPNEDSPCNLHGSCRGQPTYRCDCQQGWTGADCSLRTCAYGRAWFGRPTSGDGYAHMNDALVECSNMGTCDTITGTCSCMDGFEGTACNVMSCPGTPACNDHGECLNMKQLALHATSNGDATSYTYGATPNNQLTWDFDMVSDILCVLGVWGLGLMFSPHLITSPQPYRFKVVCVMTDMTAMIVRSSRVRPAIILTRRDRPMKFKLCIARLHSQLQH